MGYVEGGATSCVVSTEGFAATMTLEAGPGDEVQVKSGHAVLRVTEPPGGEEAKHRIRGGPLVELETHEVGSERECFWKELKSGRSPLALVPQPQRWLFVRWGLTAASGTGPLSTLAGLMRCPSGCFGCISRCSLGSCGEVSADPAAAPSGALGVLSV